jgi:ADP-ribose pyrophosphatase YjhB (NUDIX family)
MEWSPHITVATVVERNNQFLFVEESIQGSVVINQPAGHWEQGESLIEATIRETLEETAWHYQPSYLIGIYQWMHPHSRETYLRFCFTGDLITHDVHRPLDKDIERAIWLDYQQLVERNKDHRSPLVLRCVEDYINGQRFDLNLLQSLVV